VAGDRVRAGAGLYRSFPDVAARLRLFALLALTLLAILIYNTRIRHEMVDFTTWRQAAVRGLHAEPLYRPEDGHYQFKYFPVFALLMAPFGALDQDTGKMLWFAISVGLLAALLRWSVAALPGRRLSQWTLVCFAIALMAKFYAHELVLGQINLLLGALLLTSLVAVQIDRPVTAGGLVGMAVFVKPYALILAPWLLVTQGWPAAAMVAGIVAIGLLLPAAVYGWNGNLDLLRGWLRTTSDSTTPNLLGSDNVSIAAMWAKWLGPGSLASGLAWLTVAGILVLAIVAWRRRRVVSAPEYLECALLMLLIPLLSPQGWDYVLLLATPAVVCLVDRWRELTKPWKWGLGVALTLMCLTIFDIMGRTLYGQFMALSVVSVCALAVAAGLVHLRWRGLA
jgi:Glycosyltransferase family 87